MERSDDPGAPAAALADSAASVPAGHATTELEFVALYRERFPAMVGVAVLLLGDRREAEEVVQDAFIATYQRWSQVESPAAYVRQSVVNKSRDALRRRRLSEAVLRRSRPHEDDIDRAREPEHVEDLLHALSPRQRTAVVLRFYEDLGIEEIARLMHTRPGTVGSLLSRAMARLREDIER